MLNLRTRHGGVCVRERREERESVCVCEREEKRDEREERERVREKSVPGKSKRRK